MGQLVGYNGENGEEREDGPVRVLKAPTLTMATRWGSVLLFWLLGEYLKSMWLCCMLL